MSKNKTQKFAELKTFTNVFDDPSPFRDWLHSQSEFEATGVTLELACGRGEYTLALAQHFPHRLFVGVDLKGARIWAPAKAALERKLPNAAFLRTRIEEIALYFQPKEIEDIWITFPDPYRKPSRWKKRLTSTRFLKLYHPLLKEGHRIHFKTDHKGLFEFSEESILEVGGVIHKRLEDLHAEDRNDRLLHILTTFERRHLAAGKTIKYLCFSLPEQR